MIMNEFKEQKTFMIMFWAKPRLLKNSIRWSVDQAIIWNPTNEKSKIMKVKIIYCSMWNYLPDAERVSAELKEMKISDIELVPEGKGIFDVEIDGKLIFSKFQSGRFPDRGEIPGLISNQDSIKGIVNSPDASCCWNPKGFWIYPDCSRNIS